MVQPPPHFPRAGLANCLLECYSTERLKLAVARTEEGGDRQGDLRAQGWLPTNARGHREGAGQRVPYPSSRHQLPSRTAIHRDSEGLAPAPWAKLYALLLWEGILTAALAVIVTGTNLYFQAEPSC